MKDSIGESNFSELSDIYQNGRYQLIKCGIAYAIVLDTATGKVKRVKIEFDR